MKKFSIFLGITLLLMTMFNAAHAGRVEKFQVNHKGIIIEVPWVAVMAHLAHGDFLVCPRRC
jgi:hypothetical protein